MIEPPSELETQTIRYYDEHASEHANRTAGVDMSPAYVEFLRFVPPGGAILDAGCGSGRDAKFFSEKGYVVTSIDASPGYAWEAWKRTGVKVRILRFQELDYDAVFDGIWASASLLHVPRNEFRDVLHLLDRALKESGVIYVSLKEGTTERLDENERYFNDMTEEMLRDQVETASSLEVRKSWRSERGAGSHCWVHALLKRKDG